MGEFSPPCFSESPCFFFFSYPSNIKIIFDFSDWGGECAYAIYYFDKKLVVPV